jgi:hypothetical protein
LASRRHPVPRRLGSHGVDVQETAKNRQWMRAFKKKWKERLQQLELWMVSWRIEIEEDDD